MILVLNPKYICKRTNVFIGKVSFIANDKIMLTSVMGHYYMCYLTQFLLVSGVKGEEGKLIHGLHLVWFLHTTQDQVLQCFTEGYVQISFLRECLQQRKAQLWFVSNDFFLICFILICSQYIKKIIIIELPEAKNIRSYFLQSLLFC